MIPTPSETGLDQEHAQFVAVQPGGVRFVADFGTTHMRRRGTGEELFPNRQIRRIGQTTLATVSVRRPAAMPAQYVPIPGTRGNVRSCTRFGDRDGLSLLVPLSRTSSRLDRA